MDLKSIIEIIIMVVLGGLSLYFKYNGKLNSKVSSLINEAESTYSDTTKAGGEKHTYVVNKLYELIPKPVKFLFTKDMVEKIVDKVFDEIEGYAKTQLDKAVDKVIEDKEGK